MTIPIGSDSVSLTSTAMLGHAKERKRGCGHDNNPGFGIQIVAAKEGQSNHFLTPN
jgi:hypothetical protein